MRAMQRAGGRVDLRARGLDERELDARARLGAVLHRLHRVGEQLEEADEVAAADAAGLLGQARVAVGRDVQLRRDLAERLRR